MPEFAEVNKQVRWLRERAEGATVSAFGYHGGHFTALKDDPAKAQVLASFFEGATLDRVTQRAKHVVMHLSTGTLTSRSSPLVKRNRTGIVAGACSDRPMRTNGSC